MSAEDVAQMWGVTTADVEAEVAAGQLRAFRINGNLRFTTASIEDFMKRQSAPTSPADRQQLPPIHFTAGRPFAYRWPDGMNEQYGQAFEGRVIYRGQTWHIRIGSCYRLTVGMDRWRSVVFLSERPFNDDRPSGKGRPMVEFVAADDFTNTRLMVSLVKNRDGKQIQSYEDVPEEYQSTKVVRYNSLVTGPYSYGGLAVIVLADDLQGMARHAFLRASFLNLLH